MGRCLNLDSQSIHDMELKSRVSKAWGKFAMHRSELTDRTYSLRQRLRLFA